MSRCSTSAGGHGLMLIGAAKRLSSGRAFGGAVFDVVVSSLALHNIYNAREREQALGEIARVLRPGGHAAIFDVRHAYARFFERNGFTIVRKWPTMLFGRS